MPLIIVSLVFSSKVTWRVGSSLQKRWRACGRGWRREGGREVARFEYEFSQLEKLVLIERMGGRERARYLGEVGEHRGLLRLDRKRDDGSRDEHTGQSILDLSVSERVHGRTVDAEHGTDVPGADAVDFLELGREGGREGGREDKILFENSFAAICY
jgi:hypothetical protein